MRILGKYSVASLLKILVNLGYGFTIFFFSAIILVFTTASNSFPTAANRSPPSSKAVTNEQTSMRPDAYSTASKSGKRAVASSSGAYQECTSSCCIGKICFSRCCPSRFRSI